MRSQPAVVLDTIHFNAMSQSAVPPTVTTEDIASLCQDLKSHLWPISTDDQRLLLEDKPNSQEGVEDLIRHVIDELKKAKGPTKIERWAGKVDKVVRNLSPVIDSAAQIGGHFAPLIWGSIRTILQVFISSKSTIF